MKGKSKKPTTKKSAVKKQDSNKSNKKSSAKKTAVANKTIAQKLSGSKNKEKAKILNEDENIESSFRQDSKNSQDMSTPQMNGTVNIIDLILIDHRALKNSIKVLKDEEAEDDQKLEAAKVFLKVLKAHAPAEEVTLYTKFKDNEELRSHILEGYEEHAIATMKLNELKPQVDRADSLTETLEIKLKVLAEMVEHHIQEEESEILPSLRKETKPEVLEKLGAMFLKERKLTEVELNQTPVLEDEMTAWTDAIVEHSEEVKERTEKFIESFRAQEEQRF